MKYRKMPKIEDEISLLGYGCMRFPRKNGIIDKKRTEKQIIEAINNGINYFDTAYLYYGSEETLGEILSQGYRDKVKIATKIPGPKIKKYEDFSEIFEKQLKMLKTDYLDNILIHSLASFEEWNYLKDIGVLDFFKLEKDKGRIINIGFSYHGNIKNFKKIIDDYDWDFCMVQYNYIDDKYQAGSEGINYAASKNIGVIAMEPLRGGLLVNQIPNEAKKIIENYKIKRSPAEWAFRWAADNPNVQVVLSGMNEEKDIEENIKIFSDITPNSLTDDDKQMLESVKKEIHKKIKVQCTSCGYCLPCPKNVDIPTSFTCYNDKSLFGGLSPAINYFNATSYDNSAASNCTRCGACEKKCPQNIPIMDELENVKKEFEKWYLKIAYKLGIKFLFR
ncbi:aldo/keto reductase [Methanobrevibacter sp. DSM 116169]|uniref:aldo/keto reductase n=1 Tax=Methanobrevibacter sp. DSM 116169 TaxID=3242727 RepID=UPI0038FCD69E